MANFLYFIPNHAGAIPANKPDMLPEATSLRPILKDQSWGDIPLAKGPGDTAGVLIVPNPSHGGETQQAGYFPEWQKWKPVTIGGVVRYHVGWSTINPPRPQDLLRQKLVQGSPVKLKDGQEWIIPAVHASQHSSIPNVFRVNDGKLELLPIAGYEDVVKESQFWWETAALQFLSTGKTEGIRINRLRWFQFAVMLLGVNYRLDENHVDVGCLDLFTDDFAEMMLVIDAACGGPQYRDEVLAHSKKLEAAGGLTA